ncbi:PhoX family protein [Solimonas soli]|uniref:PhoX family protein n=1 Tax=Solimonas soli TaxID=413479 RepID=UPI0004B05195|nr:alkaline phosphatase PhoX [Solimonas soli]
MQNLSPRPLGAGLLTACAFVGAFALAACSDDDNNDTPDNAKATLFAPVDVATTDAAKRQVYGTDFATVDGETRETGYVTILRSGEQRGSSADLNTFGLQLDKHMQPILADDGSSAILDSNDFSSILKVGRKLFAVSQFESQPGAMYLTELAQDKATGKLSATKTTAIDLSSIHGIWNPCAGSVTPWNTHLGSEEYEPDAINGATGRVKTMVPYGDTVNPYYYGFPVEVAVKEDGTATPTKHYSMGRFAHELSYVMPDQKTVYETDDGSNVGFFRYVATTAGQLTGGTLYAAKWTQTGTKPATSPLAAADISWVELGTATDAEVETLIDAGTKFTDIFEVGTVTAGACAAGFTYVDASDGDAVVPKCLKLKTGMEKAAAFLETRTYAALKGATTEFKKEEGITFDPDGKKVYVAYSDTSGQMSDAKGDIQVAKESCGTVYAYDVDANYMITKASGVLRGTSTTYPAESVFAGNTCDVNGIGNPDNISFMPGQKTLLIGEDASSAHQNDVVWAYNVEANTLTRIASTPYGAETTSLYYYPDVNDFGYIVAVVQHPYGESDQSKLEDAADKHSYFGYIGALAPHQ